MARPGTKPRPTASEADALTTRLSGPNVTSVALEWSPSRTTCQPDWNGLLHHKAVAFPEGVGGELNRMP